MESVAPFDVYQGKGLPEGKKSLAFTLVFRATDRTLTDDEVNVRVHKNSGRAREIHHLRPFANNHGCSHQNSTSTTSRSSRVSHSR